VSSGDGKRLAQRGAGMLAVLAVLASCVLICVATAALGAGGAPSALMSATKESFLDQLNNLLLKKTNPQQLNAEDSVLAAQESVARAQRGRQVKNLFSKAQLAANACADGEGCGDKSPKPKMVYQPSTGNWDVVDAGNPDWIWKHLMQHAQSRDAAGLGDKPPKHAAHVRHPKAVPFVQNKAPMQMLAQLGAPPSAEMNKQTLLLKLRSLLRVKVAAGEPVQPKPSQSMMAVAAALDFSQPGVSSKVTKLREDMSRAKYLGRVGDLSDMVEMSKLDEKLASHTELGEICRRRHLAQDGLGVLRDESLAGCKREIRASMIEARTSVRGGLARLRAEQARLEFPKSGSLPVLTQKKKKLAAELSSMEKQHDQLRAELHQQKERITQLTQNHKNGSPPTPAAMDAASALMGFSSSSSAGTPLADALMGKKAVRSSRRHRTTAQRRHMPTSRAWSPPVPSGLPPGYKGGLSAKGNTDVPDVPPPGTEA